MPASANELGSPAPRSLHAAFVDFEFEVEDAHSEVRRLNPLSRAVPSCEVALEVFVLALDIAVDATAPIHLLVSPPLRRCALCSATSTCNTDC